MILCSVNFCIDVKLTIKRYISYGYAVYIHFKVMHSGNRKIDDLVDYDRVFNILKEYNYRGFVSLEYGGPEEEFTAIPRAIGFIKEKVLKQS